MELSYLAVLKHLQLWQVVTGLTALLLLWVVLRSVALALRPDLRSLPGPLLAKISKFYRVAMVARGDCHDSYVSLHETYGPVVRTGPNHVSISDPQAIPMLYGMDQKFIKSGFYNTMTPVYRGSLMCSVFTQTDPTLHQQLRKPVAQKFSMTSIKQLEPAADECTGIFIRAMKDLEGQKIDLGVWLQWYAFDVIGGMTFHKRFGFMEDRTDFRNMIGDIETSLAVAATLGQIPEAFPFVYNFLMSAGRLGALLGLRVPDPLRTVVEFTEDSMDEYDRSLVVEDRPDFLAWLREDMKKGKPISDRDLVNHLSNNLFAGSDTTAAALRASFYFLVKHPAVYMKLQQEIDDADRRGVLSEYVGYAESLELPYLQAVLKEAMRCCPSVSMPLERLVPKGGATICGHYFKSGTIVGVNPVVVHRDKSTFGEDAASFRPERWIECTESQARAMDRSNLTFGTGSRICLGKNISIMEMGKFVPQILRHFEIEWASDQPEWNVKTYWFTKQYSMAFRFKSRVKGQ